MIMHAYLHEYAWLDIAIFARAMMSIVSDAISKLLCELRTCMVG